MRKTALPPRDTLTIAAAADLLHVSTRTVHYWLKKCTQIKRPPRTGLTFEQVGILARLHGRIIAPDEESTQAAQEEEKDSLMTTLLQTMNYMVVKMDKMQRALERNEIMMSGPQVALR